MLKSNGEKKMEDELTKEQLAEIDFAITLTTLNFFSNRMPGADSLIELLILKLRYLGKSLNIPESRVESIIDKFKQVEKKRKFF